MRRIGAYERGQSVTALGQLRATMNPTWFGQLGAGFSRWLLRRHILLIFVLAVVLRLLYLLDSADSPTFGTPIIDSETYTDLARTALASGRLTLGFLWQPFFYPAFLVTAFALGGESLLVVKLFQVLIGGATCILIYHVATRFLSSSWALVAGLIAAAYGPLIFYDGELLGTSWETFWAPAIILCLLDARSSPAPRLWIRFGLVAGLSILTRPTYLPFIAISSADALLALARKAGVPGPRLLATGGAFLLATLLPLLPVSMLSHRLTGSWSVLPYSGGINLYIGNNPAMAETIALRPGRQWEDITRLAERHGIPPGRESSSFFTSRVYAYARTQPLAFARGLLAKSVQLVSSRELPRNVSIYAQRAWSPLLGALVWQIGPFGFPFGLLFPFALLGLRRIHPRISDPLAAFLILYSAAVILVFPSDRYRMPLIPALIVCATAGLESLCAAWRARTRLSVAARLAAVVAVAALISLPGPFPQERAPYRAEMHYIVGVRQSRLGHYDEARRNFEQAISIQPDHAGAHNSLGGAFNRLGRTADAIEQLQTAIRLDPDFDLAVDNLGALLVSQRQSEQARILFRTALERAASRRDTTRAAHFQRQFDSVK